MGFYEVWHGAVDPGGEEVWDFMRLGMGQGGGCGSKGLSEINRRSASRSMSGNIPHNGLK